MKALLTFAIFILALNAQATLSGNDKGNGGDLCEARFYQIRNDLVNWIDFGGSNGLQLPSTISISQYNNSMKTQLLKSTVECVSEKLKLNGVEKTCINRILDEKSHIVCNLERFKEITQSDQYVLVHHEYAGLAGLETNEGVISNYDISNQVSGFLKTSTVKKLSIASDLFESQISCNSEITHFVAQMTKGNLSFSLTAKNAWKVLNLPEISNLVKDKTLTDVNFRMSINSCSWNFDDGKISCREKNLNIFFKNKFGNVKSLNFPEVQISTGILGVGINSSQSVSLLMSGPDKKITSLNLNYPVQADKVLLNSSLCGRSVR